MNSPSDFVKETIEGILLAYPDKLKISEENNRVILSKYPHKKGKVGIVTGGGSGHLPVFLGYVGDGMADGCAIGNVFTSPSYQAILTAIRACDFGAGVLCLYGNYGGDKMNFNQACEDAEADNIRVKAFVFLMILHRPQRGKRQEDAELRDYFSRIKWQAQQQIV